MNTPQHVALNGEFGVFTGTVRSGHSDVVMGTIDEILREHGSGGRVRVGWSTGDGELLDGPVPVTKDLTLSCESSLVPVVVESLRARIGEAGWYLNVPVEMAAAG